MFFLTNKVFTKFLKHETILCFTVSLDFLACSITWANPQVVMFVWTGFMTVSVTKKPMKRKFSNILKQTADYENGNKYIKNAFNHAWLIIIKFIIHYQ